MAQSERKTVEVAGVPRERLPKHVAIIMDGNGRWAKERGLARVEGHRAGAEAVHRIVTAARERGLKALTLYAFSAQNWSRPESEVEALMSLLLDYVIEEHDEIMENGIRLRTIGDIEKLPEFVREPLLELCKESEHHTGMQLVLALSYGGREELVRAARILAGEVKAGKRAVESIDEVAVDQALYTADLPQVDLVIRTSGELRVSNFLLWQIAYAELYFTPLCWPDFDADVLDQALRDYASRERRFGKTSAQIADESNAE